MNRSGKKHHGGTGGSNGKKRGHSGRNPAGRRPPRKRTEKQSVRSMVRGILDGEMPDFVRDAMRHTPSTGHWESDVGKMIRELENWPLHWMPSSKARELLRREIARDPDETYIYYPIGASRPVIWFREARYSLEEFLRRFG